MRTPLDYVPGLAHIFFASVVGWGVELLKGKPDSVASTIARVIWKEAFTVRTQTTAGLTKSKHPPLLLPRLTGILLHQHNRRQRYCLQRHHGGAVHHLRRRGRRRFVTGRKYLTSDASRLYASYIYVL